MEDVNLQSIPSTNFWAAYDDDKFDGSGGTWGAVDVALLIGRAEVVCYTVDTFSDLDKKVSGIRIHDETTQQTNAVKFHLAYTASLQLQWSRAWSMPTWAGWFKTSARTCVVLIS